MIVCIKNQNYQSFILHLNIKQARSVIVPQTDLILDDTYTHNGRQCYQIIALST